MAAKREGEYLPDHQSHISDRTIQSSLSCNFADITQVLFFDILMRLPTKSIVCCKSVCKDWYKMISNPEFAKFYSTRAKPQFIIRAHGQISRNLYLVEQEQISHVFHIDKSIWNENCNCPIENGLIVRIPSSMKIPLNNSDCVFPVDIDAKSEQACLKHMLNVANSCHGLLCLSEPLCNDPVAVCNPLTGEYINLPKAKSAHQGGHVDCGLGFSPKSNAYKVIRVHNRGILSLHGKYKTYSDTCAEVLTLGTVLWRSVAEPPYSITKLAHPTYHDGALYCLYAEKMERNSLSIVSFNFDDEEFTPVPLPHGCHLAVLSANLSVLRGDLCLFGITLNFSLGFEVWAMKNNSSGKSWTKIFLNNHERIRWPFFSQPIEYFDNGISLIYSFPSTKLIYYNRDGLIERHFYINGLKCFYEVIANFTPSFISLKDILATDYVEVLNVNSRCEELKLPGDTQALNLNQFYKEDMDCERIEYDCWTKQHWLKK